MGGKERKCYDCSLPCYRDDVENESIYHSSDADTSENKSFFQYSFIPALFLLVIGTVSVIHYWIVETSECWGAPYLLVTHHDGNNVLKFSRNGCLITHAALAKKDTGQGHLREAVIGSYKGEEALYVANTGMRNPKKGLSELLVYGGCSTLTRKRRLVRKITDNSQITLAKHPYGITFDDENNVYASFQHSDAVLRFEHDTFKPMYSPASLHTTINGPDDEANDHSYLPRKTGEKVENNGLFFSMRKDTKVTSTHFKKEEGRFEGRDEVIS